MTTGSGGGNYVVYPQSLIRFGTFDPHFDLEFGAPSAARTSVGGSVVSGATDLSLGAKYELGYTSNFLYGVNAVVTVPSGTQGFTAGNAQFSGNFNWAYTLNSVVGVAGTLGANAFSRRELLRGAAVVFRVHADAQRYGRASGSNSEFIAGVCLLLRGRSEYRGKELVRFRVRARFRRLAAVRRREYGFSPTLYRRPASASTTWEPACRFYISNHTPPVRMTKPKVVEGTALQEDTR